MSPWFTIFALPGASGATVVLPGTSNGVHRRVAPSTQYYDEMLDVSTTIHFHHQASKYPKVPKSWFATRRQRVRTPSAPLPFRLRKRGFTPFFRIESVAATRSEADQSTAPSPQPQVARLRLHVDRGNGVAERALNVNYKLRITSCEVQSRRIRRTSNVVYRPDDRKAFWNPAKSRRLTVPSPSGGTSNIPQQGATVAGPRPEKHPWKPAKSIRSTSPSKS